MRKYFTLIPAIVFLLGFFPAIAQPQVDQHSVMLDELIKEAIANNPKIEAALQRTLSVEQAVSQAGALPDPQLSFSLSNIPINSFAFDQEPMTGKQISIMQMFPFPGKQSLKTDMAELESTAVKYQQEEIRNQVVNMVKQRYYDLYAVDRAFETTEKNKALMEQFVRVAETKYATGSGLQQDVLRAQVELSKLEDDLIMWEQKRLAVVARLNAILNRPADSPLERTPQELSLPSQTLPVPASETIEQQRPALKAMRERIQKSEAAVQLAKRDLWPNFAVGASYRQRDNLQDGRISHDYVSAVISLNIPLYMNRKQKARIAEKELDVRAISAEYENLRSGILSEVESILADLERNRKRVELYKGGILLQAEQSLDSAHAGYRVGKVDFLTLINNWMMLQNYELQYYFALSNFYKSRASYDLSVGKDVTGEETIQ